MKTLFGLALNESSSCSKLIHWTCDFSCAKVISAHKVAKSTVRPYFKRLLLLILVEIPDFYANEKGSGPGWAIDVIRIPFCPDIKIVLEAVENVLNPTAKLKMKIVFQIEVV